MLNEQHIWNWIKQCTGLNDFAIAAIMGNIEHESAGSPKNVEDRCPVSDDIYTQRVDSGAMSDSEWENDAYGYGICQWTLPIRKKNLRAYAKQKNKSISDLDTQLEFLVKELMSEYLSVWNALRSATNIETPCDMFLRWFENPDGIEVQKPLRRASAVAIYNRNHGKDATSSPVSASSSSVVTSTNTTPSGTKKEDEMCTVSLPVLRRGSMGISVRVLQAALLQRGIKLPTYGVDGYFEAETENAVKLFQASGKLVATGVVEKNTYELLFK